MSDESTSADDRVANATTGLRIRVTTAIDLARVPSVLGNDEAPWLGERVADGRLRV